LDELKYSDIVIHVVDGANPARSQHMKVVYDTLKDLECLNKPIITFLNKYDLSPSLPMPLDSHSVKIITGSAKTGANVDLLISECENEINSTRRLLCFVIPYNEGSLMDRLRKSSEIVEEEFVGEGIKIKAYVNEEMYNRANKFIINEQ
jgi:GTP-binding protein HflX